MKDKTARKSRTGLYIFMTVVILLLLTGIIFMIHANSYVKETMKKYDGKILDNVTVEKLSVAGLSVEEAEKAVTNYINNNTKKSKIILKCEDVERPIRAGKIDIDYDVKKAAEDAYNVGRTGNVFSKYFKLHEILEDKEGKNIKIKKQLSEDAAKSAVLRVEKKFNRKPVNARIKVRKNDKVVIVKEKNGIKVKEDDSIKKLVAFVADDWDLKDASLTIDAETDKPKYTSEDFKDMTDVLGKCTTEYDWGYTGRRKNIENGADKIDGSIVKPGKVFSVYKAVAPFTPKNGYYLAGTYQGDEVVDDYGGGICQVATTLYNAAIKSELKIKERHNHGMTIHYVPLSFDAAISGQDEDLKFENNLDHPIYIKGHTTDSGTISFYIIGKETRPKNRKIEFTSKTLSVSPPGSKEIKDKTLTEGTRVVERYGVTGYSAELWKTIYVDGKKKKSYKFNSSYYNSVSQVVRVGTKKKDKKDKKDKKGKKKKN